MKIGGWQKTTLIDFPGHLATTIFVRGCNFRCPFCFNRELVFAKTPLIPEKEIFSFLKKRKGFLDGVVITGGEPTLQTDIEEFLQKIKKQEYKIKLDTNGSQPTVLKNLLRKNLLDYVAIDFKAPLLVYAKTVKNPDSSNQVAISIKLVSNSGIPFELRTTVVPGIHDLKTLEEMAKEIMSFKTTKSSFFRGWYLQNFQSKTCLDPKFEKIKPYRRAELEKFLPELKKIFKKVVLR